MFNWREYPFIRLLIPFIIGVLIEDHFRFKFNFFLPILISSLVFILFYAKLKGSFYGRIWKGILINFILILSGIQIHFTNVETNNLKHFNHLINEENALIGIVDDQPSSNKNKIKIRLKSIAVLDSTKTLQKSIRTLLIYLDSNERSQKLNYGDLIYLKGQIYKIPPPSNPLAFNYQQYLFYQNIHFQSFVKPENWFLLSEEEGSFLFSSIIKIRQKFIKILEKHLKGKDQFAVGAALILGYKDEITEEIREMYTQTGAMHVLAVSGLHVGLIFLLINTVLKIIRIHHLWWQIIRVLIILSGIWMFALITGASPSVLRAASMFSFITIGLSLKQYTNIYNTLAASAFCLLLIDPFLLMNIGFQLSYLAVLGIIYFQPKIAKLWIIKNPLGKYLWELISVSIAAQLMTLPVTLFYFHQFPVYFWLSGLIVVPAAGFILGGGLILFLLESISPILGKGLGVALNSLIEIVNWSIATIQSLSFGLLEGIWINQITVFFFFLGLACFAISFQYKRSRIFLYGLCCTVIIGANYAHSDIQNQLNKQIVIYDIYKSSLIDFIDGNTLYSLDTNTDQAKIEFASKNLREALNLNSHPIDKTSTENQNFFNKDNFIQFFDKKIIILNEEFELKRRAEKWKVDFIVIQNNPDINMNNVFSNFEFEEIIFDHSNRKWNIQEWEKECKKLNITSWNVIEKGAYIYNL